MDKSKLQSTVERVNLSVSLSHRGGIPVPKGAQWRSKELYKSLGGREVVEVWIDDFYSRIADDPKISPFFPHFETGAIKAFFHEWLGGAKEYSASPWPHQGLDQFHMSTYVTRSLALRWLSHMRDSLSESQITDETSRTILEALRPMALAMVNSEDPPVAPFDLSGHCNGVKSKQFVQRDQFRRAAARGQLDRLEKAIAEDPGLVRFRGENGRTLLWEAASKGRSGTVEFLLGKGADSDLPGCDPSVINLACSGKARLGTAVMTAPLAMALSNGKVGVADMLTTSGAKIDFFSAAYLGNKQWLSVLLAKEPSLISREDPSEDYKRITALHHAIAGGQAEAARWLIEQGAEVLEHSSWLLTHAALQNREDLVRLLLDSGADARCAGVLGPLDSDHRPVADLLISRGFDLNSSPSYGAMLVRACRPDVSSNETERVKLLLGYGADVNQCDHRGKTALHYAARSGRLDLIRLLLDNGADPNRCDVDGLTPLAHLKKTRAKIDTVAVMELLVSAGADINCTDKKGETLLFFFARQGDTRAVRWLMSAGAKLDCRNKSGKTVVDLLRSSDDPAMKKLLRSQGG